MPAVTLSSTHPLQRSVAEGGTADSPLLKRLYGQTVDAPPSVWFMRQAGRSLPEYKKLREGTGMLESCLIPEMASEITCQPVRRHEVDAGIFFSDIMVPLKIAGLKVEIQSGVGPVLDSPIRSEADIENLPPLDDDYQEGLGSIREAVRLTVRELGTTPLIGFSGAPFTVASYMIEGRPSRDHLQARAFMTARPDLWQRLATWVANASGLFMAAQIEAGASAAQLFDSWAGSLSEATYREHVQPFSHLAMEHISGFGTPRTHFALGSGHMLAAVEEVGATAVGLDHRMPIQEALMILKPETAVQGNIDPSVLFSTEAVRFAEARKVVDAGKQAAGHVVNLGHGVPPTTDARVLTDLVSYIHSL